VHIDKRLFNISKDKEVANLQKYHKTKKNHSFVSNSSSHYVKEIADSLNNKLFTTIEELKNNQMIAFNMISEIKNTSNTQNTKTQAINIDLKESDVG